MSVVFGVYNRGGGDDVGTVARKMMDALSYWQPDDSGLYFNDDIALGHLMLWNTPESKSERLPDTRDSVVITVDVRLDNRQELIAKLGIKKNDEGGVTDSAIIAEAYRKWGRRCPGYLLGDFTFAIWDEETHTLFCARDHVGIRQLYYHAAGERFIFTSDLRGFDALPELVEEINDDAVANYLMLGELVDNRHTFFKSIFKLPPAHTLTITADSCDMECYWHPENAACVDVSDLDSCVRRLRELLEDAVVCRLRTAYPVVSHLSGGLDSSSIAVIAARRLKEKGARLHAVNWVYPPEGKEDSEHYEWKNSRVIAAEEAIVLDYVDLSEKDIRSALMNRDIAHGDTTRFWYEYPVREAAGRLGARTLLSGWGGDELATYHGQSFFADLFFQKKIISMCRELHRSAAAGSGSYIRKMGSLLYHDLFLLMIPEKIYVYLKRSGKKLEDEFPFLSDGFLSVFKNKAGTIALRSFRPKKNIRAHMVDLLLRGHLQSRIESLGSAAIKDRIEYSYPLLDKRIVELVLSAPPQYFFRKGKGRYLFRLAAKDLLPTEIMWSDAKSERFRVQRLLQMTTASLKKMSKSGEIDRIRSEYLNSQKIAESIEDMGGAQTSRKEVMMLVRLVSAMSLLMSRKLCTLGGNDRLEK